MKLSLSALFLCAAVPVLCCAVAVLLLRIASGRADANAPDAPEEDPEALARA